MDALKPQRILRLPVQLAQVTVEAGDFPIVFRGSDVNECIHNVHIAIPESNQALLLAFFVRIDDSRIIQKPGQRRHNLRARNGVDFQSYTHSTKTPSRICALAVPFLTGEISRLGLVGRDGCGVLVRSTGQALGAMRPADGAARVGRISDSVMRHSETPKWRMTAQCFDKLSTSKTRLIRPTLASVTGYVHENA